MDIISNTTTTTGTQINVNLDEDIIVVPGQEESVVMLKQIQELYTSIQTSQAANHLGSINDYRGLFESVKLYYERVESDNLNVKLDVSSIDEFTSSLRVYSSMFEQINITFSSIIALDDRKALRKLYAALTELYAFYQLLERFKANIVGVAKITVPETIAKANEIVDGFQTNVDSALDQIEIFLGTRVPSNNTERDLNALSAEDRDAIDNAKKLVETWTEKVEADKKTVLDHHTDVVNMRKNMEEFNSRTDRFQGATQVLGYKFQQWKLGNYI